MPLWMLTPVADADDPIWQDRRRWDRVVVRASNPAFARLIAQRLDTPDRALQFGDQHPGFGSGFASEKLYRVSPYTGAEHVLEGPNEIVERHPWTGGSVRAPEAEPAAM